MMTGSLAWSKVDIQRKLVERELGHLSTPPLRSVARLYGDIRWINNLDIANELKGHSGCVNALSWSKSGQLLASGSDDRQIIIHKYQPDDSKLPFIKAASIATGHMANIFSCKFMPHTNDRTLVSAAGDRQVRVFDIEYTSSTKDFNDTGCRVYRCHTDRVKRVVTESSPHLFLTCSEDGEVRQWDLRQPSSYYPHHSASDHVPPALISYKRYSLDINSISCSTSQPHYIALGGAHHYCFLHDRRMIARDSLTERGVPQSSANPSQDLQNLSAATQCVRRFGLARSTDTDHITAVKISDARPSEVLVSWSGEYIYSFDIAKSPNAAEVPLSDTCSSAAEQGDSASRKRRRLQSSTHSNSAEDAGRGGSGPLTEQDLLRIRWNNGQTEYVPVREPSTTHGQAPAVAQPLSTEQEQSAARIIDEWLTIRKTLFSLDRPDIASLDLVFETCCAILPRMKTITAAWVYPLHPTADEVDAQNWFRDTRSAAARFVQHAGIIARVLGANLDPSAPHVGLFLSFRVPIAPSHELQYGNRFVYAFIKAIILWVESGVGALLQGFTRPASSQNPDLPVPQDSGVEAIELVIAHLESLASSEPVLDLNASRYEVDDRRWLYASYSEAVHAFAEAVKIPFADLSTQEQSDDPEPGAQESRDYQDRSQAKYYWVYKVARGLLWNAAMWHHSMYIIRAFGGLGQPSRRIRHEENLLLQRHADIDAVSEDSQTGISDINQSSNDPRPIGSAATSGLTSQAQYLAQEDDQRIELQAIGSDDDSEVSNDEYNDEMNHGDELDDDDDEYDDHDDTEYMSEEDEDQLRRAVYRTQRQAHEVEPDVPWTAPSRMYTGHCNVKTVKDVGYYGLDDEYVVSGSDDGNLFIWDRKTSRLLNILEGDGEVVNVIQGHPYEPMLAVSGIDNTVKIFSADARARDEGFLAGDSFDAGVDPESEAMVLSSSRMRMNLKDEIIGRNEQCRKHGNADAGITSDMLARLAAAYQLNPRMAGQHTGPVQIGDDACRVM